MTYPRRSMGDQLRATPNGPRELDDSEWLTEEKARIVVNPEDAIVKTKAHFQPPTAPEAHEALVRILDDRGGKQRGKPRARGAAVNPLGVRVFCIGCGWPMYRTPSSSSFRYTCGFYQQSHGAHCRHNHIDGVLATNFARACLRQKLASPTLLTNVKSRIAELARQESPKEERSPRSNLDGELRVAREQLETIKKNMVLAKTPLQVDVFGEQLEKQARKVHELEAQLRSVPTVTRRTTANEAEAALGFLERLLEASQDLTAVDTLTELLQETNTRFFFNFEEVTPKIRTINVLRGGYVTYGSAKPPIKLYDGPTDRKALLLSLSKANNAQKSKRKPLSDGQEEKSLGNVSRGDRIRTCDVLVPNQVL
jgi:hypothetical protein